MAPTSLDLRIRAVDATMLTPILRRALGRSTIRVTEWSAEPLRALKGGIGGSLLYHFTGSAEDRDETIAWSLILKVLTEPVGNDKRAVPFPPRPFVDPEHGWWWEGRRGRGPHQTEQNRRAGRQVELAR